MTDLLSRLPETTDSKLAEATEKAKAIKENFVSAGDALSLYDQAKKAMGEEGAKVPLEHYRKVAAQQKELIGEIEQLLKY